MKTAIFLLIGLFALAFLVSLYRIYKWNYELKMLRMYPHKYYGRIVCYNHNEYKQLVKILFHFSDDSICVELQNGNKINVIINELEPIK